MIKNLYELYNLIEKVSTALPNVNQFVNSFDSLNREDTSYAAVVLQFRDGTQATEGSVRYRFYLGYVDRVNENTDTPSTSNNILTQSIAEENIRLIINKLYPEVDITFGNTFYPFTQRFTALTAGCYVELAITLAVKDCNYESGSVLRDVEIVSDSNGVKEVVPGSGVDGFKKVIVRTEVPLKEEVEKDIVITENGNTTYTPNEGEVFNSVSVDVNVTIPAEVSTDVAGMKYANSTITEFPSNFQFAPRSGNTDCVSMFYGCESITSIPLFDTQRVTSMYNMFVKCKSLTTVPQLDTSKVTDMSFMFEYCKSITSIPLFDTSEVTNMSYMFDSCPNLTSIPQFDTSKVTNMSYMFSGCTPLTSIPLFDTSKVTDMSYMFSYCRNLTSIPQLDTSKVTTMNQMFYGCDSLTSVSRLDAASLTDADNMFGSYYLPFEKFTTFGGLTNLKVDLDLSTCPNLTHDSLMNVINEAADVTASPKTLTLGADNLAKLTDEEKAIATNKGWVLA